MLHSKPIMKLIMNPLNIQLQMLQIKNFEFSNLAQFLILAIQWIHARVLN